MADQKVNIKVSTTGAKKSKDELSGLNGAINKMGKAVGVASAAYFGAKGLISAFSTVIEASARQEQAEKALEVALGRTSRALLNQASALQSVTTAGDEALIEQQAFLASLKFTEDQIKTIIPVALDLSAATGISLESAVRNTAKTFSGLAGELGELVPQLRDLTQEEMKAGDAVKVLADLFEGQASEQAKTMAGALQQAQNSAGDLAEAIGNKLSPFVKVLAEDFTKATTAMTNFIGPDVISREEQLQSLLEERSKLLGQVTEKTNEAVLVSDLFTESAIEQGTVQKDTIDIGLASIDEQIAKFSDLLFVKQQDVDITRASNEGNIIVGTTVSKVNDDSKVAYLELMALKKKMLQEDMRSAALSGQSAKDAMKSVVRAETMEAVVGYISSVLKTVPFPANLVLAAGGGAIVGGLIDKGLSSFATGGDFVTSGPQMIMVGDNPGGRERVQVSPLSSPNINGPGAGGVTVNIQGGIVDESYVSNELIPAINKATSLGTKLNA